MTAGADLLGLHPDEVDDLVRVLALVEDWLIGCSYDTAESLARFLGVTGPDPHPEQAVRRLSEDLGRLAVAVARQQRAQQPQATS